MKKISSIKKLNNPYFNMKIGTFDKKNPEILFIEGSTYIIPNFDDGYMDSVNKLMKDINKSIRGILKKNSYFSDDFIDIVELPVERMKKGKRSYFYFECHLKQKKIRELKEIIDYLIEANESITEKIYDCIVNTGFDIIKNK